MQSVISLFRILIDEAKTNREWRIVLAVFGAAIIFASIGVAMWGVRAAIMCCLGCFIGVLGQAIVVQGWTWQEIEPKK